MRRYRFGCITFIWLIAVGILILLALKGDELAGTQDDCVFVTETIAPPRYVRLTAGVGAWVDGHEIEALYCPER